MSAIALNTSEAENEIILGKNLSAGRRSLAFLSIVIVYFLLLQFYGGNLCKAHHDCRGSFRRVRFYVTAVGNHICGYVLRNHSRNHCIRHTECKDRKKVYIDCGGVTDCADHIPAHDDTRQLSGMAGVQADYRRYPGRSIRLRHASGDGTVSAEIPRQAGCGSDQSLFPGHDFRGSALLVYGGLQLAGADVYSHHTSGGGGSHDFPVCTQRLPEYQAVK